VRGARDRLVGGAGRAGAHGVIHHAGGAERAGCRRAALRGVPLPCLGPGQAGLPALHPTRGQQAAGAAAVASFLAAVLTEIYQCNVCACQEILRRNGRGQAAGGGVAPATPGAMAAAAPASVDPASLWTLSLGDAGAYYLRVISIRAGMPELAEIYLRF
jgi:hypothetical protein